ncbi:MAG: mechanosensitive ion channel domain-containing protein [Infirmifilum sp.]|uniref:mechanosensitive ion channel domain-containing protein n=1 Tax=Infirmifilum TaxID=2856573 RepID=UPI00069B9991|nr:mechanosensitive ion channel domain-containing protein [Infirmifilum uzonense]
MSQENIPQKIRGATINLILWILLYIIVNALIFATIPSLIPSFKDLIDPYSTYIGIGLALFFGYMIVRSFSNLVYWMLRIRHPHSTAAAVRSIFTIMGIGALAAGIAGGAAGGAAGVALGGFIGMIIGYATQQVLGQAVAGLFVLLARPVRIGDYVNVAGEQGVIEDISTLFTQVKKDDGTIALIPNNQLVGSKIYIIKRSQ